MMNFVADDEKRLDVFLSENLGDISRSQIKNHIDCGKVFVNGKNVKAGYKLRANDCITLDEFEEQTSTLEPQNLPLNIVFEDDQICVIDKEQGMVVHPGNGNKDKTLVNALLFHTNLAGGDDFRPGIVHRIDKNTSGLIVVSKTLKAHEELAKQIASHTCKREYEAVCEGVFKESFGRIETNIGRDKKNRTKMCVCPVSMGKKAITNYKVLKQGPKFAHVHFVLETGRTHQIRVHCSYIGHPIVGDSVYGSKTKVDGCLEQLLHAVKLTFVHPTTKKTMVFESKLPNYFENFLKKV